MQRKHKSLSRESAPSIAYHAVDGVAGRAGTGTEPGIVFLGGFMSDMSGIKAAWLQGFALRHGLPYLRFDYSGHGISGGAFEDGTIGGWLGDTLAVLDELTAGPQILVGSSMGGWLALLAAQARPQRIKGIVGIAAAPDFTEELIHNELSARERETLFTEGVVYQDSNYGDKPYAFTRALIEDGRTHLLLGGPIRLSCPVRLLQGTNDPDVSVTRAERLRAALAAGGVDVTLDLIEGGDHRLSREEDLQAIGAAVMALVRG